MAEKSYRIRTNVGQDTVVKASLTQDIEFLEVLSLKINQEDTYRLHVSNYGIIVGRVLANEAFGIPNAKISVFIKLKDEDLDRTDITNLYPYKSLTTKDSENRRYNLLSDSSNDDCYRIVGTFPNKRLVLDNETEIEIYEKYWKYTTTTNQSGDYMIFGVPTGSQTIHVDVDLSDIGILSQKPRDFFYKGYNKEQFDSAEQFQESTNLDNLTQLLSQNTSVHVFPFFGDSSSNDIAITRCDIQIPYKFEPTCVFFGSIVSDRQGHHIGHACGPSRWVGYNGNMVTGEGTIEMIRKTPDGLVEEFPIKGNRLIDGDGVWCYQIPMNLDYIGTDEFGNIIPVQDSTKGIPTRTSVRFRISMQETKTQTSTEHVAKYLVPNIHELNPQSNFPQILKGKDYNACYEFGSATPKEYFRDLLWNKVYSIKNYIPRFEHRSGWESFIGRVERSYMSVRTVNAPHANNVFPYNSARFRLKFTYRILCLLMMIVINVIGFYNKTISEIICWELSFKVFKWRVRLGRPLGFLSKWIKCIGLKGEWFFEERADTYYFPKCDKDCGSIIEEEGLKVEKNKDVLKDVVQQTLALEYDLVNFDFSNDWINGTLYLPLWFWKKRAKKKFFFGLFSRKAVNTFCSCDKTYSKLFLSQSCSTTYDSNFKPLDIFQDSGWFQSLFKKDGEDSKRHKRFANQSLNFGVIKEFTNNAGLHVYYYAPGVPLDTNYLTNNGFANYTQLFATDIILLGSLNNCDLDNLPKTFESLPSTTVNLPFIATFESDESGDGVVTGLDWGHDGAKQAIKYQNGLVMDLTCWDVYTRFKSCVNLSRLSELHVTLDMDMTIDDESEESIVHDGLITSKELVEHETRAKFASLNHNGMTNLTKNVTTNYDTYKFHYIYPVNLNGHLDDLKNTYVSNKGRQVFNDFADSNYSMYRLGEGKDSALYGRHKKHFYVGDEKRFAFPLYNNSFYFYFGLKEGKTAIDKFNSMFNAVCSKRNKFDFTIEYISNPGKWCYNIENRESDFGTIDIEFNGLTDTFSYKLINEFNEVLIEETDITRPDLRFGYYISPTERDYVATSNGYKRDGVLRYLKTGEEVKNSLDLPIYLENGVYFLEVTNSLGRKVTQKINMIQNVLTPNIESISLGTKYKHGVNQVSDICGDMDFYGELKIKSFIVDGEEVYIKSMTPYFKDGLKYYYDINGEIVLSQNGKVNYKNTDYNENKSGETTTVTISGKTYSGKTYEEPKEVTCKVLCTDGSEIYLIVEPENDETQDISNFVCYGVGNIPTVELEPQGEGIYTLVFNIWKPGDYVLTSNQICDGVMNDNVSINTFSIENGEKFQAFLNGIPMQLIQNENFKNTNRYSGDTFPRAWLQLENPKLYNFAGTKYSDIEFWENFMDLEEQRIVQEDGNALSIISPDSKIEVLRKQLETIATMRNIGYIMGEENNPQLSMTTKGGKEPILIRCVYPNYNEITEENEKVTKIIVANNATVEAPIVYPHIVGKHYQNVRWWIHDDPYYSVRVNDKIYGNLSPYIGNYFAAFTNNGGILDVNDNAVFDNSLYVEASPENANPLTTITTYGVKNFPSYPVTVYNSETAYFRSIFVDKRLTIQCTLWPPIYCNYDVYGNGDTTWKNGKITIAYWNAAPLPYDEEYNIIGDELAYSVMAEDEQVYVVKSGNTDSNDFFKYSEYEAGKKYVINTNFGVFKNATDRNLNVTYGGNVPISGKTLEELQHQLQYYFLDDKVYDLKFNGHTQFSYKKLVKPTMEHFKNDTSLRLVSHLDWYTDDHPLAFHSKRFLLNNSKLYKFTLDVDGIETDLSGEFTHNMYGSEYSECIDVDNPSKKRSKFAENGINNGKAFTLPNQGSKLTVSGANCKLTGDLTYEIEKNENDTENYVFKSHVEPADEYTSSFDIGPRVNVQSFVASYNLPNAGEYIIWNNEKIYLERQNDYEAIRCDCLGDDHYEVDILEYKKNSNGIYEKELKRYRLGRHNNSSMAYYAVDNGYNIIYENGAPVLSGYVVATHIALDHNAMVNFRDNKTFKKYKDVDLSDNSVTATSYYKGDDLQNYLNKYGVPIYANHYHLTGNSNNFIYGFDLDHLTSGFSDDNSCNYTYGSYIYSYASGNTTKYKAKPEYKAFKIIRDKVDSTDDKDKLWYVFYSYRDAKLNYEPRVMFYKKRENNVGLIKIPTLIYKKAIYNTLNEITSYKYYEFRTSKFEIFKGTEETYNNDAIDYALKIEFYISDRLNSNIFKKSLLDVKDGDKEILNGVEYTFEFNDLNNRWYVRNGNTLPEQLKYKATIVLKKTGAAITTTNIFSSSIYYEGNTVSFNEITDKEITMTYREEINFSDDELKEISSIPEISYYEDGEEYTYFWIGKEKTYERKDNIITIDNVSYQVYNGSLYSFKVKRIDDFVSKTSKDSYNDDYDSIEANAPTLLASVVKKYAFNEKKTEYSALDGGGVQAKAWVSSNKAIVNQHPNNVVNGLFLTTKACAIVNDKYYYTTRWAVKNEKNEYVVDKNGQRIKIKIRPSDSSSHDLRFWEIILLRYIALEKTDCHGVSLVKHSNTVSADTTVLSGKTNKEAAEYIINNMITWVNISDGKYDDYFRYTQGPDSKIAIDIAPHCSMMDKGSFECWDLKLQKYGNKYYYQGTMHVRNVAKENITISDRKYSNCNPPQIFPYINAYKPTIKNEWSSDKNQEYFWWEYDKTNIKKYFFKSPVLGETYVYMDLLKYGTINDNGLFELVDDWANQGCFPGIGSLGVQYGHYEPIRTGHQTKKDGLTFYNIDGTEKKSHGAWQNAFAERGGIGAYDPIYTPYYETPSQVENPYESSDYYDNLVNVYQPNINNEIVDGTEMITCLLSRTYYDTSKDYRFKVTTSYNQSTNFSVAPIYIGQPKCNVEEKYALVPFYLIDGMNDEVKKGFEQGNLKYYFNHKENIYKSNLSDSEINESKTMIATIYPSYDSIVYNRDYGYCKDSGELKDRISSSSLQPIPSPTNNKEEKWYFGSYDGLKIENARQQVISLSNNIVLRIRKVSNAYTRNVIKITPIYNVLDKHIAIENNILSFNKTMQHEIYTGNTITLDLDAPLSSFSQYHFSTSNGDTCEISGETRIVDLLDEETIVKGETYNFFSGVWKMNKSKNGLELLEKEKIEAISKSYSEAISKNKTVGEYFKDVMTHCGYYESKYNNDIVNGLKNAFAKAFTDKTNYKNNDLVLTSLMPHRLYELGGQEYLSYGNAQTQNVNLSYCGVLTEKYKDNVYGLILPKIYDKQTIFGKYHMLMGYMEVVENDINPNAFMVELTDPYDNNLILQKFKFYGFDVNNQYKYLVKKDDKNYLFESTVSANEDMLHYINASLRGLSLNDDCVYIVDNRVSGLYPNAFEKTTSTLFLRYLYSKSGVKNNKNAYIKNKTLNITSNYALYDSLNIFNRAKPYNKYISISDVPLSSGVTNNYWDNSTVYQKGADIIFLQYAKFKEQNENITQIICEDGYSTINTDSESLTVINSNGDKETFSYGEIYSKGMLGLSLYHLTEVDGIYYEFVSKISKVKQISNPYVLKLDLTDLITNQIYVLSLDVNNLIYKLPFTYDGSVLKPNFTDITDIKEEN